MVTPANTPARVKFAENKGSREKILPVSELFASPLIRRAIKMTVIKICANTKTVLSDTATFTLKRFATLMMTMGMTTHSHVGTPGK